MAENKKKQIPLRLSTKLYNAIAAWAEDDFRSINGQIEYLLTECVRQRKKNGKYISDELDVKKIIDQLAYFGELHGMKRQEAVKLPITGSTGLACRNTGING